MEIVISGVQQTGVKVCHRSPTATMLYPRPRMTHTTTISARRLLCGSELIEYPVLTIDEGHITSIQGHADSKAALRSTDSTLNHRLPDALLVPAFLNIHVHGSAGFDVMQGTPEAMRAVGASLAGHGVGAYYPTTVTASVEETLRALDLIANTVEAAPAADCAVPLGIHLEGPFLSVKKRGVHATEKLVAPSVSLFDRFWQAARGHIRILTIAPELPGAPELITHTSRLGRCFEHGPQRWNTGRCRGRLPGRRPQRDPYL